MTSEQQQRIAAQVQAWRDAGQHEHAEALRTQMWAILGPYLAPARAHLEGKP
jgi:glutamate dehydrogenase/leucine dehydrogenase